MTFKHGLAMMFVLTIYNLCLYLYLRGSQPN